LLNVVVSRRRFHLTSLSPGDDFTPFLPGFSMNFDWQNIAVALIVFAACIYAGRRAWARLRAFGRNTTTTGADASTCSTGCGACGDATETRAKQAGRPASVLVQIGRSSATTAARRRTD
jgi:hypothetical protein